MRKTKVIIITNIIAPYRVPLFNRLAKENWLDLKVFFCKSITKDRQWDVPRGIRFKYRILKGITFSLKGRSYYKYRTVHFNPGLIPGLIKMEPDIVISAEYSIPSIMASFYCRAFGKKYISWSEGIYYSDRNISLVQKFLRKIIISNARACIGCSTDSKKQYISLGAKPEKVFISIQTIDVKSFKRKCEMIRKEGKFQDKRKNNERIILYVGSLIVRKGVIHLLDAVKILAQKFNNFRLILVGDGVEKNNLRNFCNENIFLDKVHFVGFQQQPNLPNYYAIADVFVLPTLEDTFGVVVNEAMAAGLPILCSKFAGAAGDLIKEGINGYRVDPNDHHKMANYLFKILTNDELRLKMGKASEEIIKNYGIEAATEGFLSAIRETLKKRD